jgi:hypothetical protein
MATDKYAFGVPAPALSKSVTDEREAGVQYSNLRLEELFPSGVADGDSLVYSNGSWSAQKNAFFAGTSTEATETFDGTGAQTDYTVSNPPIDPRDPGLVVSVGGVIQEEITDYTVDLAAGTVSFVVAPVSGTDNVSITYNGITGAAPTVANDETEGFAVGAIWHNPEDDTVYLAVSVSEGNALWIQIA